MQALTFTQFPIYEKKEKEKKSWLWIELQSLGCIGFGLSRSREDSTHMKKANDKSSLNPETVCLQCFQRCSAAVLVFRMFRCRSCAVLRCMVMSHGTKAFYSNHVVKDQMYGTEDGSRIGRNKESEWQAPVLYLLLLLFFGSGADARFFTHMQYCI